MSSFVDTLVSFYRPEGTPLTDVHGRQAKNIPVQITRLDDKEQNAMSQLYNWHGIYLVHVTTYNPLISFMLKREDVLIDQRNIDPDSSMGSGYRYIIIDQPRNYVSHQLILCEYSIGN